MFGEGIDEMDSSGPGGARTRWCPGSGEEDRITAGGEGCTAGYLHCRELHLLQV